MCSGIPRMGQWRLVAGLLLFPLNFGDPLLRATASNVDSQVHSFVAEGHAEGVFCVAFGPDGKHLASVGDEGEVVIWDAATWREVRNLRADPTGQDGHREDVWGLAFSPDGKQLASASHDETVRLWDVATGRQLRVFKGHSFHVWGVAFSPDGMRLASAGGKSDESGQFSAGEVKVWDVATGQALVTMTVPAARVYDVTFSPDGKRLASAWEDKTIKVWDATSGQALVTLTGHADEVRVVVWSPDNKHLASGADDKTVRLWDVATHREARMVRDYHGVAFSADGKVLAMGGAAGVGLWDAATGKEIRSLKGEMRFSRLALSPNGKHVVWDTDRTIKVWTPAD